MSTIKLQGVEIEFYDTSETMPMRRYNRFDKYLMISSDVGNDLSAFNTRISKGIQFLKKKMIKEAAIEFDNFRQAVRNAYSEYNLTQMALALRVHKIDGEVCKGIDEGALNEVIDRLDELGFTQEMAIQKVSELKKK